MGVQLERAKQIIGDKSVDKSVKALLLLRLCMLLRLQGRDDQEWNDLLRDCAKYLEGDDRAAYKSLGLGPEKRERERGGFVADTIRRIDDARELSIQDAHKKATAILLECERNLARRWWHWGKSPAWSALLNAWAVIDRFEALQRIKRLPAKQRPKALHIWNQQTPLTVEEWAVVEQAMGSANLPTRSPDIAPTMEAIDGMAQARGPMTPMLNAIFFDEEAKVVRAGVHQLLPVLNSAIDKIFFRDETGKQVLDERQKGLAVFLRIMAMLSETVPDAALPVAIWACKQGSGNPAFDNDFSFAFRQLTALIIQTASLAEGKQNVLPRLLDALPHAYADLARVLWYGTQAKDAACAKDCYVSLMREAQDKQNAARLYLTRLCGAGLAETALSLAKESPQSDDLLPRVRRAWLCSDPASAREKVTQEDFPEDRVVQLLLLPDARARGEFLRRLTSNGKKDLPTELWESPGVHDVLAVQEGTSGNLRKGSVYGGFYGPATEMAKRFAEYARLHSFGFIGNETVDPFLLGALVVWGEDHPNEIEGLVHRMARKMQPDVELLMADVVRNTAFTRARAVLPAVPKAFLEDHLTWIKQTLVDNQLRIQVDANSVRVLSMPARVLFLFTLMGAENVAKFSSRLSEDIIAQALNLYPIDSEFLPMAARLYASNAGLSRLDPPSSLPTTKKREWQKGIVAAAVPLLASEIMEQASAPLEINPSTENL